jgi:hypothetical protein
LASNFGSRSEASPSGDSTGKRGRFPAVTDLRQRPNSTAHFWSGYSNSATIFCDVDAAFIEFDSAIEASVKAAGVIQIVTIGDHHLTRVGVFQNDRDALA